VPDQAANTNGNTALVPQIPGLMVGANETASTAAATQAAAAVQARYAIAYRKPRIIDQVRVSLLQECRRPAFAEVARYHKPIGEGIEGPSIRFAEAAARCMGNILVESPTVYDDHEKRIVRVLATDLETNITYQKDVTVSKTMERRKLQPGQTALRTRVGSRGDTLYIIEADDDAILNKENALVSKAMRTVLLRLIPGDLVEEAMNQVDATLQDKAAKDPDAERKKLVDAFAAIGVQPSDLVAYLEHDIAKVTPPEIVLLRKLYAAIRDGEVAWAEVVYNKAEQASAGGEQKPSKTSRVHEMLEQRRSAKGQATASASAPASDQPVKQEAAPGSTATEKTPAALPKADPRAGF
jgi:hypothetical protein